MTIDRKAGHAERMAEDHVRGLAADAGQIDQLRHVFAEPRRRGARPRAVAMPTSERDFARKKPVDWICGSSSSVVAFASARASG